jgi:branched-chain amino acid aminotransferase
MATFDFYNGSFIPAGTPVITADSRALRYGDGLFETIKLIDNQLLLASAHFDRLFHGLALLHLLPASCNSAKRIKQKKQHAFA